MVIDIPPLPVYILAGGQSSRFGSDKARASIGEAPLLATLAEVLAPVASAITVVADRPGRYNDLGLRTLGDVLPGQGPLGGLFTAIEDMAGAGWLALVACDWAGLQARWIDALCHRAADGAQCVLYRHQRREPLLALYHTSIGPRAEAHLEAGRRSMSGLLESIRCTEVDPPDGFARAVNINSRDDLAAFLRNRGTSDA